MKFKEMSRQDARNLAMKFWNESQDDLTSTTTDRATKVGLMWQRIHSHSLEELFPILFGLDDLAAAFTLMHGAVKVSVLAMVQERPDEFLAMAHELAGENPEDSELNEMVNLVGSLLKRTQSETAS